LAHIFGPQGGRNGLVETTWGGGSNRKGLDQGALQWGAKKIKGKMIKGKNSFGVEEQQVHTGLNMG